MSWQPIYLPLSAEEAELLQRTAERLQAYVDGSGAAIQRARRERSPGSELSALLNQHSSTPPEVELAEMRFFAALEHLATLSNAMVPGNAPLIFAPFTLMRTALEAAGYAAWAWEPDLPPGERSTRGLQLRWDNLNEVVKMTRDAGAIARRDGLGVHGPPAAVEILGDLLPSPLGGGRLGEKLYRQLAGRGHAQPWTFVGAGAGSAISSDENSVSMLLKPNLPQLVGALAPTLEVVECAVDRFGRLAGVVGADWWGSRPLAPVF
jgi:hypothetical protein